MATDEEIVKAKHPTPWYVHEDKLRPQFPAKIVEVCDDNCKAVLPWQCFDHMRTHADKKHLARFIVKSVNDAARRIEEGVVRWRRRKP